jgi:hypothetical protein
MTFRMEAVVPSLIVSDLGHNLHVLGVAHFHVHVRIDKQFVWRWRWLLLGRRCTHRGGCHREQARRMGHVLVGSQRQRRRDAIVKMDGNAESLVRGHGCGEALFERQLAIAVIIFHVCGVTPDAKLILNEEDVHKGHQCRVGVQYILDHPIGDQGAPFRMECVQRRKCSVRASFTNFYQFDRRTSGIGHIVIGDNLCLTGHYNDSRGGNRVMNLGRYLRSEATLMKSGVRRPSNAHNLTIGGSRSV